MALPDPSLLETWENRSLWAGAAVAVGVILEACDLVIKWKRKKRIESILREDPLWMLVVETLSLALIAGGLVVETYCTAQIIRVAREQSDAINTELSSAKTTAADANKQAGEASERAAITESNNLVLRSNVVTLEMQMQPRIFETFQSGTRLKEFSGTKAVVICSISGDAPSLGSQVSSMLTIAGWIVDPLIVTAKPVPSGIVVGPCSTNSNWDPEPNAVSTNLCINSLVGLLNDSGVDAKLDWLMNFKSSIRFDGILIIVGQRPTGVELEVFKQTEVVRKLSLIADNLYANNPFPDPGPDWKARFTKYESNRVAWDKARNERNIAMDKLEALSSTIQPSGILSNGTTYLYGPKYDRLP